MGVRDAGAACDKLRPPPDADAELDVGAVMATVAAAVAGRPGWAVLADVVVSGSVDDLGIRYAVGVYNLFDWDYALPVSAFPTTTLPQRGRRLMVSLSLEL